MPVRKVIENGQVGYKWGDSGTTYFGPRAKQKAELQGRAAHAGGYTSSHHNQSRGSGTRPNT